MNLLLLDDADRVAEERWVVCGPRARHIAEVLRAAPGRPLRVARIDGPLGTAEVLDASPARCELACRFEAEPPPRPKLELVLAIPRPKVLRRLLPDLAAFGVDRLILLRCWRVEPSYLDSGVLAPDALRAGLIAGAAQGGHPHLPRVERADRFEPFVEAVVPGLAPLRWLAHPHAETELAELRPGPEARLALAIGPEGGWIEHELGRLGEAGFLAVRSGAPVLRSEAAVAALLAQIELLRRL